MKILVITSLFTLLIFSHMNAQEPANEKLPFASIESYPEAYCAGGMLARLVDGLGYRYYWATEGLRAEDLEFRPSEDARSAGETIDHLYGLSQMIALNPQKKPNIRPSDTPEMTFEEMRAETLQNFKIARDLYAESTDEEIEEYVIIFQRGEKKSEFPFWHMINGPIADAIYHTGQIVSFRRTSGNPSNSKVNVFMGKNRP